MILALSSHLLFLCEFKSFFEQIFNAHLHDDVPNVLAIIINT